MMNNIGSWYENKGETDSAFHYYYKSLEFRKSADHRLGMFLVQSDIAKLLLSTGKTDEALKHADESIRIGEENGFVDALDRSYMVRSNIREERGDFKGALQDIKRYLDLNNQTKNEEDAKTLVQQTMRYEYNLKHVTDSISYRAEIEVQEEKVNKERYARNAFMIGFLVVALFAGVILVQRNKIRKEQNRSQQLLLNILPEEVAEELKEKGAADAKHFDLVTVMFTDFKGFTQISEKLSPAELVNEIHACFKEFDQIISRYHIEKIKTIGDSYMCAGGLPVANKSHAVDVVNAALEIQKFMDGHNAERAEKGKVVFEIRIGIHTGPVVAGIVGVKKFAYDIWGDTVNIASRMESSGEAGMVNISSSTYDMVKDNFVCTSRGKIDAKNKGEIEMYFVEKKV